MKNELFLTQLSIFCFVITAIVGAFNISNKAGFLVILIFILGSAGLYYQKHMGIVLKSLLIISLIFGAIAYHYDLIQPWVGNKDVPSRSDVFNLFMSLNLSVLGVLMFFISGAFTDIGKRRSEIEELQKRVKNLENRQGIFKE